MQNLVIVNVQILMAIAVYALVFFTYFKKRFQEKPFHVAILPLLFVHCFRFLGLNLLVTGQVDPSLSREALQIMAYGDFASAVCALIAAIAILLKSPTATAFVLLFTIVGIGDFISIAPTAYNAGVLDAPIGTMWFLMSTFAPLLLLTHIYIAYRLILQLRGLEPIKH
jgi:uncharacterized membrane protein